MGLLPKSQTTRPTVDSAPPRDAYLLLKKNKVKMFQATDPVSCPYSGTLNEDGLHSCSSCNVLHFALFQDTAEAEEIMETNSYDLSESTMNPVEKPEDESDILTFIPTESDMDIVKSDSEIASGAVL